MSCTVLVLHCTLFALWSIRYSLNKTGFEILQTQILTSAFLALYVLGINKDVPIFMVINVFPQSFNCINGSMFMKNKSSLEEINNRCSNLSFNMHKEYLLHMQTKAQPRTLSNLLQKMKSFNCTDLCLYYPQIPFKCQKAKDKIYICNISKKNLSK